MLLKKDISIYFQKKIESNLLSLRSALNLKNDPSGLCFLNTIMIEVNVLTTNLVLGKTHQTRIVCDDVMAVKGL